MGRGIFIVLEGIDRSGKTEQLSKVMSFLERKAWQTVPLSYPDRCTGIGMLIRDYLEGKLDMTPECIHLLFSANRWEQQHMVERFLNSGVSIVCDRYAYSGYAYTVGAWKLNREWARMTDRGLIKPDVVYQIDADPAVTAQRNAFGAEIYENQEIQERVREAFKEFHEDAMWVVVPASLSSIEAVTHFIWTHLDGWLKEHAVGEKPGTVNLPLTYI